MKNVTLAIGLLGLGYTLGITLVILGCTAPQEKVFWLLFLFAPYMFTPLMTVFIDEQKSDGWFWNQFAFFIISFSLVTAFAMPLVFFVNGAIGGVGLGYGLGADFVLYLFLAGGLYYAYKQD